MLRATCDQKLTTAIAGSDPRPLWYGVNLHGRSLGSPAAPGSRRHSAQEQPPHGSSESARLSGMLCETHRRRQPATDRPEQR